MNEEMMVVISATIIFIIIMLLLPVFYIVISKLLKKAIKEEKLDEKKVNAFLEYSFEYRFRRYYLFPVKYGCVASAIFLILLGIFLKDIRIALFSIFPIVYLLICRYILKKKGRW